MRPSTSADEGGFSLMELLVAMLITVIVSGAIYGLIASGQTAFRREPELAERQQNIRIAMDLIQRDVLLAGQGVPWFGQVFTRDDFAGPGACGGAEALNGCGTTAGTLGANAAAARASGAGDPSEVPDVLQMISSEEQCPFYTVCVPGPGTNVETSNPVLVRETFDASPLACMQAASLLLATNNYNFAVLAAPVPSVVGDCGTGAAVNRSFTTTGAALGSWVPFLGPNVPALQTTSPTGGGAWITQARIARYEIAPDPLDQAPSLWRSTTGLFNADGSTADRAGANVGTWQLVARGIEDLQVEYMDGTGVWQNRPTQILNGGESCGIPNPVPTACPAEAVSLTTQVRVTLSARSMMVNIVGAVPDGNQTPGTEALRGQLQAVISPRAAKVGLSIP